MIISKSLFKFLITLVIGELSSYETDLIVIVAEFSSKKFPTVSNV